jgi:Cu2+-containing amine oxidase
VRNTYPRQITGLTAVVDLNAKRVLRVVDEGLVPVTSAVADYDPASIGPPRDVPSPMRVDQPLGPGFRLEGHIVEWQKWRFHVRSDQRVGTIVSTVMYGDGDARRHVLYEGHLSEIFVPYMDPAFDWYRRNFLDAGEFSAGGLLKPLARGLDCPEGAVYLDGLVADDEGRPKALPNVMCLFEREAGDMAWRHFSGEPESRRKRDLVVRSAAVLGNYDYVFELTPGMTIKTLLTSDDHPRRRAGFIDHQLWVTSYRPEERYAAGDYPTLSTAGQGLPNWTRANRRIEQSDIVLWYTTGMHHVVRAEDWPVMPVLWHSFELRPFDFFDRNPALDLPRR